MGTFIAIDIDESAIAPDVVRRCAAVCPVDIYFVEGGRLRANPEREDECTLCELCLEAAPVGAIRIRKLYKDETLVSRGS